MNFSVFVGHWTRGGPRLDSNPGCLASGATFPTSSPYVQKAHGCGVGTVCVEGIALALWNPREVLLLELFASGCDPNTSTLLVRDVSGAEFMHGNFLGRLCPPSDYRCNFPSILLNFCRTVSLIFSLAPKCYKQSLSSVVPMAQGLIPTRSPYELPQGLPKEHFPHPLCSSPLE